MSLKKRIQIYSCIFPAPSAYLEISGRSQMNYVAIPTTRVSILLMKRMPMPTVNASGFLICIGQINQGELAPPQSDISNLVSTLNLCHLLDQNYSNLFQYTRLLPFCQTSLAWMRAACTSSPKCTYDVCAQKTELKAACKPTGCCQSDICFNLTGSESQSSYFCIFTHN